MSTNYTFRNKRDNNDSVEQSIIFLIFSNFHIRNILKLRAHLFHWLTLWLLILHWLWLNCNYGFLMPLLLDILVLVAKLYKPPVSRSSIWVHYQFIQSNNLLLFIQSEWNHSRSGMGWILSFPSVPLSWEWLLNGGNQHGLTWIKENSTFTSLELELAVICNRAE